MTLRDLINSGVPLDNELQVYTGDDVCEIIGVEVHAGPPEFKLSILSIDLVEDKKNEH